MAKVGCSKKELFGLCVVFINTVSKPYLVVFSGRRKNHRVSKTVDNKGGLITFDNDR